jgi:hypothetical protein
MIQLLVSRPRNYGRRGALLFSLASLAGCHTTDSTGPAAEAPAELAGQFSAGAAPSGILFATSQLPVSLLGSVHTGVIQPSTPSSVLSYLAQVKAKGGRVLIKLHGGEGAIKNTNGTFNRDKWKSMVSRYRTVNLTPYITDGTIVGHYIVDEPNYPSRWGGTAIPQATVEELAKHSKSLWPTMATIVSAPPAWFASTTLTYTHLDAAWAMYLVEKSGSPTTWAAQQVNLAKKKRLGLFSGLNVLDGGNGSSGVRGTVPRGWNMTAAELRSYGSALLAQSYVCGFSMWRYQDSYYNKPDIRSAMVELSNKAKAHAKTSCRQ